MTRSPRPDRQRSLPRVKISLQHGLLHLDPRVADGRAHKFGATKCQLCIGGLPTRRERVLAADARRCRQWGEWRRLPPWRERPTSAVSRDQLNGTQVPFRRA